MADDTDFRARDPHGNKAFGISQSFEAMRKALDELDSASAQLGHTYDELNQRFLQNGLK